ncbi:hypothetical protein ACQPZF_27630 [Actinosynnema sp. CS-041913]|uniref:Vgb family protein n=1 Tax=Actinosynnema sp. CS-041913 TaxID=3239917 RepID=UPI003D8E73BB
MDRRAFHRSLLLGAFTASASVGAGVAVAHGRPPSGGVPRRSVVEYGLPPAERTHEMVKVPGEPLVLVSQSADSKLVKLRLDPATEEVVAARAFPLGSPDAVLHGLAVSHRHPGMVWATHESANRLLLIDPGGASVDVRPEVVRTIDVPGGGEGPHHVGEYDGQLWVSLRRSRQVLAIDPADPARHRLHDCRPNPVFVARHPGSGDFYVTQDDAGLILRIDPRTRDTAQLAVPAERGGTPMGLVAGPTGLWVALLGSPEQGTGTFGRIDAQGRPTWFHLRSPEVAAAALLHLAFDPPGTPRRPRAWLLGSSIVNPNALDVVVRVTFDPDFTRITGEEVAVLPTQHCKAHRLLPLRRSVLATELTSSTVAQLTTGRWDRPTTPVPGEPG